MPAGGSFMAGVCGAVLALLADVTVSAFYGWRIRDHVLIAMFLAIGGFLVGFLAHRRLAALSRKARRAELNRINLDGNGLAG
jgi:hypothetical protein